MGHDLTAPSEWLVALDALVSEVVENRRQVSALQAREARLLADAAELVVARTQERRADGARRRTDGDLPLREVSAELAAALRLSDRTVQARMSDATTLTTRFPATWRRWASGGIDAGHVGAILDAGACIDDDALRARFEHSALAAAETESPARLRAATRVMAAVIDPSGTVDRVDRAQEDRRVGLTDRGEGMARLFADIPATLAHAALDRLTQLARVARSGDDGEADDLSDDASPAVVTGPSIRPGVDVDIDGRTMDQLRADVLCDLLLAGGPIAHGDGLEAMTGHVQVLAHLDTLAGRADAPAVLAGYGPIDADTARCLAARATGWDRVVTDPLTGAVLAVDRYRPGNDLTRFLRARDEHCRFPGCRRPARRSDIDHTVDAALGGETSCENLAHLCRRHHTLKHASAWRVRQRGGGVLEWTSPTGRRYQDRPPGMVRFVPSGAGGGDPGGDPPPF